MLIAETPHVACGNWLITPVLRKFDADIDEIRIRQAVRHGMPPDHPTIRAWADLEFAERYDPSELVVRPGNLLMVAGVSKIIEAMIGGAPTYFNAANAYIGVGDSSTAEAITQSDLQASTNKLRVGMDSGYPKHTDGSTVKTITGTTGNGTSPITVTSSSHGFTSGFVHIQGVAGNTAANGVWLITNVTTNTFDLVGSTGNGTYTSGGTATQNSVGTFSSTFSATQAVWAWNEWAIFNASSSGTMLNRKVSSYGTKPNTQSWQLLIGFAIQ